MHRVKQIANSDADFGAGTGTKQDLKMVLCSKIGAYCRSTSHRGITKVLWVL